MNIEHPLDLVFNIYTALAVPFLAPIFAFYMVRRGLTWMKIIAPMLFFIAAFTFFDVGTVGWFMRDGMGPDAVTTTGMKAFTRFAGDFWLLFLFVIACLAVGLRITQKANHVEI